MPDDALYRQPTVLDSVVNRDLKLAKLTDHAMSSTMHACFLAVAEFVPAAREFVIVFVRDEVEGRIQVQPTVMLGAKEGENLFIDGKRWDARYVPAYIRRYPFWTAKMDGVEGLAVLYDAWWSGFSATEGDPLYLADGTPAPRLKEAIEFIEQFEVEAGRTMEFCNRLVELQLLRVMNANLTLPGGQNLLLNGFLTVDEEKLRTLPDATVVELHRNGMLGLIHAHLLSLGNMQTLVERQARRMALATPNG